MAQPSLNPLAEFYHPNVCHICKKTDLNLKRCSNCKTLAYCSKEHQKEDWPVHKALCKVISVSQKLFNTDIDAETYQLMKHTRCFLWNIYLLRKLHSYEEQVCHFSQRCTHCHKNATAFCLKCFNESYCSLECKRANAEKHNKHCETLKLALDFYLYKQYVEVLNLEWKVISNKVKILPKNLEQLVKLIINSPADSNKLEFIMHSEHFSHVASILYGLEKTGILKDRLLQNIHKLTVHIIIFEGIHWNLNYRWDLQSEILLHWVKNLFFIDLFIIQPHLNISVSSINERPGLCERCSSRDPEVRHLVTKTPYQVLINCLGKPNLIAVFANNVHAQPSQQEIIDILIKHPGVPLIITSFNDNSEEIHQLKILGGQDVEVLVEPHKNPFSNIAPIRHFGDGGIDEPIFYVNAYISILIGKEN